MLGKILPTDDNVRRLLRALVAERGESLAALSRHIGRNAAYLQQFVARGSPRRLPERERRLLARHLGIDEALLGGEPSLSAVAGLVPLRAGTQGAAVIALAPALLRGRRPESLYLFEVRDRAMAPAFLPAEQVVVDGDDRTPCDGVFLMGSEARPRLRRLTLDPTGRRARITTDSAAHADWDEVGVGKLVLLGRAIWSLRPLA